MKNLIRLSILSLILVSGSALQAMHAPIYENEHGKLVNSNNGVAWINDGIYKNIVAEATYDNDGIAIYFMDNDSQIIPPIKFENVLDGICGLNCSTSYDKLYITVYNKAEDSDEDVDMDENSDEQYTRIVIFVFNFPTHELNKIASIDTIPATQVISSTYLQLPHLIWKDQYGNQNFIDLTQQLSY